MPVQVHLMDRYKQKWPKMPRPEIDLPSVCGVVSCNRLIVNCIRLCIPAAPVEKRLACGDSFWGTLIINKIQIPFPQTRPRRPDSLPDE